MMSDIEPQRWIGFDLDGTLAVYHGCLSGPIGDPIEATVALASRYLAAGHEVRIVTARVSRRDRTEAEVAEQVAMVEAWSLLNLGQALIVTCEKDQHMDLLYDDRCVQVVTNTGKLVVSAEDPF